MSGDSLEKITSSSRNVKDQFQHIHSEHVDEFGEFGCADVVEVLPRFRELVRGGHLKEHIKQTSQGNLCSAIPELSQRHLKEPQIMSYQTYSLQYMTMLLTIVGKGSALRIMPVWMNLITCASLIALIFGLSKACGPVRMKTETHSTLFEIVNSLSGWTVFLFGPYIGIMLSRWWTLRCDCLGGMWGNLDDLMLLIGSSLHENKFHDIRDRFYRWAQAVWLLCQFAFAGIDEEEMFKILCESGALTQQESKLLKGRTSQPQIIICWMAKMVERLSQQGKIQSTYLYLTLEKIIAARGATGYLFAHFDTPVLYSFVHLMALMVNSTNALECVYLAVALLDLDDPDVTPEETDGAVIAVKIVKFLFRFMTFQGLLGVVTMLRNPFSTNVFGMPLMEFFSVFSHESSEFVHAGNRVLKHCGSDAIWQASFTEKSDENGCSSI